MSIVLRVLPKSGRVTVLVDEAGIENLRSALDDVGRGNKVILGDPGATLAIQPDDWKPADD